MCYIEIANIAALRLKWNESGVTTMNTSVYIVESSYYKHDDKFSCNEYTHSIMSVHKNFDDALDVLRAIHKKATQTPDVFDIRLDEKVYRPYVIYRWLNEENKQYDRLVQIITRDLT